MIKVGMFLPAGTGVEPEPCFVDNHEDISRELGGGMFDVVVTSMGQDSGTQFVGFVRDEFLFDGSEYNYLATALFKRDIRGGCVVMWGVDDTGIIDGEIYDLPEAAYEFLRHDLLEFVSETYNQSVMSTLLVDVGVACGLVSEEWAEELYEDLQNPHDEDAHRRVLAKMNDLTRMVTENEEAMQTIAKVVMQEAVPAEDDEEETED
jgi:hypothetical protein